VVNIGTRQLIEPASGYYHWIQSRRNPSALSLAFILDSKGRFIRGRKSDELFLEGDQIDKISGYQPSESSLLILRRHICQIT